MDEDALCEILTKPKNSLIKQYIALLATEGVELEFDESGIREIAKNAAKTNEKVEDIGARRLHTVMEKVLEDISYEADSFKGQKVVVDDKFVSQKLDEIIKDEDLAKYIL